MTDYRTKIGHAHLKVRDLARSVQFYTRYFDLKVVERVANYVFLSGGDFHHEIAIQAIGEDAPGPVHGGIGLYHVAFEVPDKKSFALAYRALQAGGVEVGAVDHLISWAMYFDDPDGNGLEIYWDTRREPQGKTFWHGVNLPLDDATLDAVLEEA